MAKQATADLFVWEGMNKSGNRTKGEISGTTIALVKADLRRQGITPLKVKKKPKPLFGGAKNKKITAGGRKSLRQKLRTVTRNKPSAT